MVWVWVKQPLCGTGAQGNGGPLHLECSIAVAIAVVEL